MWFISRLHRRKAGRKLARANRFVPRLECLEDRTALSTVTVLNNHDSGAGSLRDAIAHAKDGDTIVFDPGLNGQTIALTSDQLEIKKSLDIEGPGARLLVISGNDINRVFDISEGSTVTIAGLTITHGQANASKGDFGGSGGDGSKASGVVIVGVSTGGAIANDDTGTLVVDGCTFSGNQAIGGSGATGRPAAARTASAMPRAGPSPRKGWPTSRTARSTATRPSGEATTRASAAT